MPVEREATRALLTGRQVVNSASRDEPTCAPSPADLGGACLGAEGGTTSLPDWKGAGIHPGNKI
jgi:hypothetical protein